MKNTLLLISTFVLTVTAYSQLPQSLQELHFKTQDSVNWKKLETRDKATMNRFLQQIYNDTSEYYFGNAKFQDWQVPIDSFAEHHQSSVHLIDLNGDNRPEAIFAGFQSPGYNNEDFTIYLNLKDQFVPVVKEVGKAVAFQKTENGSFEAVLWDYPCCDRWISSMSRIPISRNGKAIVIGDIMRYHYSLVLWEEVVEKKLEYPTVPEKPKFFVKNKPLQLHFSPWLISDEDLVEYRKESPEYWEESPLYLAVYPPGTVGTIWNEYLDDDGQQWYFVGLHSSEKTDEAAYLKQLHTEGEHYVFGWIPAGENVVIK